VAELLRAKKLVGYHFLRQRPIGNYIADFLSKDLKLIIDVDSNSHNMKQEYDENRHRTVLELGYTTLRFTSEEVRLNIRKLDTKQEISRIYIPLPPFAYAHIFWCSNSFTQGRLGTGIAKKSPIFAAMRLIVVFLAVIISSAGFSQSSFVQSNNREYSHIVDRYLIQNGDLTRKYFLYGGIHSISKPLQRYEIGAMAEKLLLDSNSRYTARDLFNLNYLLADNPDIQENAVVKGDTVLRYFYRYKAALYAHKTYEFSVQVNPVLNFTTGIEQVDGETRTTWINTRGAEIRGQIGRKVGFYTYLTENQIKAPLYLANRTRQAGVFPGAGLTKPFKNDSNTFDFFEARGYITFDVAKLINFQFGHDRNFIGNGYRSLVLSDFSKENLFLKIKTNVWRINYTNLFMQLNAFNPTRAKRDRRSKYMAFHHLSVNIGKRLNIGIFESIIFSRGDSATGNGRFDYNYLNPVIFYRAIEQSIGGVSSDNALLGFDIKYNPTNSLSFYGQAILDEFNIAQLRSNLGSYLNKFGLQAGMKYINAFTVNNLDIQLEVNSVRPYTYQHFNPAQTYTNLNTPLAHPLGANFNELIAIVRYQPMKRLNIIAKAIYANYGTDTAGLNYGGDISRNYFTRVSENGNSIGQGVSNTLFWGELTATYMPTHNLFFDIRFIYRQVNSGIAAQNTTSNMLMVGMRLNIGLRGFEF